MKINIGGKSYDIDDEKLKTGDDLAAEVSIETTDIIRTTEEDETFKNNTKIAGQKIGSEIAIKEFKKHIGVDVEGKTSEAFGAIATAYKNKVLSDANVEPDKKVQELQGKFEELQGVNSGLKDQLDQEKENSKIREQKYMTKAEIFNSLPDNLAIPKQDMVVILDNKFDYSKNDSGVTVVKDKTTGKIYQNPTTLDPTPAKDVLKTFFTENTMYVKGAGGGAGGGSSDPRNSGVMSIEDYTAKLVESGKTENSPEFNAEMQKAITENRVTMD